MKTSKRNDDKDEDRQHKSSTKRKHRSPQRHRQDDSKEQSSSHKQHHDRNEEQNNKHSKSKHSNTKIKSEKDFDRRHDDLSRRRRQERNQMNYGVKSENHHRNKKSRNEIPEHERYGKPEDIVKEEEPVEKEMPNLGLSGALTEDTNTYRGVVIKYNEPPEARIPKKKWRLYPFKGDEELKVLHLHRQSGFLIGKLRRVVDIPIDHPSCSKQHAALQFRLVGEKINGKTLKRVKPYIIDLESTNGTYVNNNRIDARRYVELKEQDVLKFGFSSREYVLLHDKVDTSQVENSDQSDSE